MLLNTEAVEKRILIRWACGKSLRNLQLLILRGNLGEAAGSSECLLASWNRIFKLCFTVTLLHGRLCKAQF